jgi:5'-deoxynucleotidase YfbR-like HD superfamily hydrolase
MDAAILVMDFKEELIKIGANIDIIQDMLIVHDSGEPYMVLRDVTPHCKVNPEEKRRQEEAAIRDIFRDNAYAFSLWIDMEEERTLNGRIGKEIDKLQAIKKARYYEDKYSIP